MSERPLALVTGGCHRLGAAIAARLGAAGWDLALQCHSQSEPAPDLAAALIAADAAWTVTTADLEEAEQARNLPGRVAEQWGRSPRLLVNSAAVFGDDRLDTTAAAMLMRHYAINCAAPVLLTAAFAALPGRRDRSDEDRSIVNILDQRIAQPHGDQLAYTLSKVALAGFTHVAARELAPRLRVNAVAPGLTIPTDDYDPEMLRRIAAQMPLRHLPAPDQVAEAVRYLATATSVTGQILFVDAGSRLDSWPRDFMHVASAS